MKFAKSFERELEEGDFPKEWISASIQYKHLKKVINKVVNELSSLGLNASTLQLLVSGSDGQTQQSPLTDKPAHLQYEFEGTTQHFQPKILLTIDDDLAVSADLSPETKQVIEELMNHRYPHGHRRASNKIVEITDPPSDEPASPEDNIDRPGSSPNEDTIFEIDEDVADAERKRDAIRALRAANNNVNADEAEPEQHHPRTIEITLHADSEFFNLLKNELASIDNLQARQKEELTTQVKALGTQVTSVTRPDTSASSSDLYAWREIFLLYRDAGVFFAATERDHGPRTTAQAKERIENFQNQLVKLNLVEYFSSFKWLIQTRKFKNKNSRNLLNLFLNINKSLLQSLYFQEINTTATRKILKKFDKRTALTARSTFPEFMSSDPFFADSLARAVCYVMSENLLSVLPQLDDYTCPVCASITYRPVRLACSHVFCIRCLIVLQRQKKSKCPICRREVVMQADSGNIDENLLKFLKLYFPKEVKAKQNENEKAAGLDLLENTGLGPRQMGERGNCIIA